MSAPLAHPGAQTAVPPTAEDRAKDEAKVNKANAIRAIWKTLATAFSLPQELPPRNKAHWDFVLQEGAWLAHDFMQERLWRQAAAYRIAHSAAAFNRKLLRSTKTKVCQSVEVPPDGFGRVRPGKEEPGLQSRGSDRHSVGNGPAALSLDVSGPSQSSPQLSSMSPVFITGPELLPLVLAQLEEEDVSRLARHAEAQARYHAVYDEARRQHPAVLSAEEEELLLGRRKARKQKPLLAEDGDGDMAGSPLAGRPGAGRPRPGGAGQPALSGRAMGEGDLDGAGGARDRRDRKRKNREYEDGDYEVPVGANSKANRQGSMRPPLGPGASRADLRTDMQGVMAGGVPPGGPGGPKVPGAGMARNPSGIKSPQGKGQGMQRQDSMARMGAPGAAGRGIFGPRNSWSPLDDQVLVAFVTEFGQNWYLVADVLRTASSMAGISRRHDACRTRYIQLLRSNQQVPEGEDLRPDQLSLPLMTKPQAKEVMQQALPVSDNVLAAHRNILAEVVAKLQQRRAAERAQSREMHKYRAPDHASHVAIQSKMLATTGGRVLNPLEIGVVAEVGTGLAGVQGAGTQGPSGGGAGGAASLGRGMSLQDSQLGGAAGAGNGAGAGTSGSGGGLKLPPGMTREQLVQLSQGSTLQQLQQQARNAQAAAQASPTPQNQAALQTATAVLSMAQSLQGARMQQQQLQQQQLLAAQQKQQAAGAGALGTAGVAGGGVAGPQGPVSSGSGLPPTGGLAATATRTQSGGSSFVSPQQIQQLVQSGRVPASVVKPLLNAAQAGQLTAQQVQQVLKNAAAQQLQQQQQAAAAGGARPPAGMSQQQLQQLQAAGQQAAWPNQAAHAAAAAAAANQAASQAAAAALAGAGGMPGMQQFQQQPQQQLSLPRQQPP